MNLRASVKICIWLTVAILVIYLLAESTQLALFIWLGMFINVWLFLNLYWLGICVIAYLNGYSSEAQEPTSIEKNLSLLESTQPVTHEVVIPAHQSQSIQQTTSK